MGHCHWPWPHSMPTPFFLPFGISAFRFILRFQNSGVAQMTLASVVPPSVGCAASYKVWDGKFWVSGCEVCLMCVCLFVCV